MNESGEKSLEIPPQEVTVEFNPEEAPQYLEGVEYPASKEEIVSAAEGNDAPEELLEMLGTMGRPSFNGPEDVVEELEASPTSG